MNDLRVRRRDLKAGRFFLCTRNGMLNSGCLHACGAGEPVLVRSIYDNETVKTFKGVKVRASISGEFLIKGKLTRHLFQLCDLRKMTDEDWD